MSASDFVTLTSGPTVPVAALQLAWQLEDRGCTLRVDGDTLLIGPRDKLTTDDRLAIKRWRSHLMALAVYRAPEVQ